jgi:hypothetical protein
MMWSPWTPSDVSYIEREVTGAAFPQSTDDDGDWSKSKQRNMPACETLPLAPRRTCRDDESEGDIVFVPR